MDRFRLFPSGELGMHPTGEWTSYADAQRALDAEREKVKELEAELEEYRSIAEQQGASKAVSQLATLQAQLRQVEGERDAARHRVDELEAREIDVEILQGDLTTLRQLVSALPVVDGRMDVECGACYYIRSFVAGQYGIVCGLMTEQSTAMAIKTLLEYRATLAAKDAPHPTEERS